MKNAFIGREKQQNFLCLIWGRVRCMFSLSGIFMDSCKWQTFKTMFACVFTDPSFPWLLQRLFPLVPAPQPWKSSQRSLEMWRCQGLLRARWKNIHTQWQASFFLHWNRFCHLLLTQWGNKKIVFLSQLFPNKFEMYLLFFHFSTILLAFPFAESNFGTQNLTAPYSWHVKVNISRSNYIPNDKLKSPNFPLRRCLRYVFSSKSLNPVRFNIWGSKSRT